MQDLEVFKQIPGYKAILKAVLKNQIQSLVQQLAQQTGEESVLLTASLEEGTLTQLGSDYGKIFLEGRDEIKSQFLGFCLKRNQIHKNTKEFQESKPRKSWSSRRKSTVLPTVGKRPVPYPVSLTKVITGSSAVSSGSTRGNPRTSLRAPKVVTSFTSEQKEALDLKKRHKSSDQTIKTEPTFQPTLNNGHISTDLSSQSEAGKGQGYSNTHSAIVKVKDQGHSSIISSNIPFNGQGQIDGDLKDDALCFSSAKSESSLSDDNNDSASGTLIIDQNQNTDSTDSLAEEDSMACHLTIDPLLYGNSQDANIEAGQVSDDVQGHDFEGQELLFQGQMDQGQGQMGSKPLSDEENVGVGFINNVVSLKQRPINRKPKLKLFNPIKKPGQKSLKERKAELENYLNLENTDRPYPCTMCPKRFKERHHLVYHLRTHSGHRPYACVICGKSFTQSSSLNTHRKLHLKDMSCNLCGKVFRKISLLQNHACKV